MVYLDFDLACRVLRPTFRWDPGLHEPDGGLPLYGPMSLKGDWCIYCSSETRRAFA